MINSLKQVEESVIDVKTEIEELDNAILELHTEIFERIQTQFSNLDDELSNLGGLFKDFDVTDGKGNWSNEGVARLGLLTQQYELAKYQVQQYNTEIDELNKQYLAGKYSLIEYQDQLADLSKSQWEAVNATESIKDAIVDLNETRINETIEGIEEEIDAYRELIEAQIDALDAAKDLHDYEESIAEKTKSVTDLERQIAAMQNDNTAATVAKRLLLEEELAEARKDLENAEYDHSIETQKDALNKQLEDYETERNAEIEALKLSLEEKETLIAQSFETVKANANLVGQEIALMAQQHGITVSDALITSWQSGETAIASYGTVLSAQSSAFIGNIMGVENEVWNLQTQANTTADSLAWMFATRADNLVNELANSYYSEQNLNAMTQALQASLVNTLERGYNVGGITSALDSIKNAANSAADAIDRLNNTTYNPSEGDTGGNKGSYSIHQVGAVNPTYSVRDNYNKTTEYGMTLEEAQEYIKRKNGYATGVHKLDKDEIAWTQEYGHEMILSPTRNAILTPLKAGDSVLTKEQTDMLYQWSKLNPDLFVPKSVRNMTSNVPQIATRNVSSPVNIHYDSLVTVNGDINDTNHFLKQVTAVAHNQIVQFNKDLCNGTKYRSGLDSKWMHNMKV